MWSKIDIWQRRPCKRRFPNDRTKVARLSSVRRSGHRSATGVGGSVLKPSPKPSLKVRPLIQPRRCGTRPMTEAVCRRAARLSEPNAERADQGRQVSSYTCPGERLCRRLMRRRVTLDERENRVIFNTSSSTTTRLSLYYLIAEEDFCVNKTLVSRPSGKAE